MDVIYYENSKGEIPVKEFIDKSSPKDRNRIAKTIELLQEFGNKLDRPYAAPLKNGINELRIKGVDNNLRILFFYIVGNTAVLTHGFIKKSKKVPSKEIKLAEECRIDFNKRRKQNEI